MKGFDLYEVIHQKILDLLAKDIIPWRKEWQANFPENASTGKPYRGINVWILNSAMQGYKHNAWITFNQAKESGGGVKAGEKGTMIIFWKLTRREEEVEDETAVKVVPIMRYYYVFNLDQCYHLERLRTRYSRPSVPDLEAAEGIISGFTTCPKIVTDQKAFYSLLLDEIHVPDKDSFNSPTARYSVLYHEMIHSTGHQSRLNRPTLLEFTRFGDPSYSEEELVAEMGAAYLIGYAGMDLVPKAIENQSAYIKTWLSRLNDDKRILFRASSAAQRAADYLLGLHFGDDSLESEGNS